MTTTYEIKEQETYDIVNCVDDEAVIDPSKTGPRPKKLKAAEVWGYEVGRGLRRKIVNPDDIYKLAQLGCNDREIARWVDINEETLRYNFSDQLEKGRLELKMSLRRKQIDVALNGNAVMLIFLGKNMLGQSDNPGSANDEKPLPWSDD